MKKIVLIMLVFALSLSLTGAAIAAAPKPPAKLCLDAQGGGVFVLVVKPTAAIKMLDGAQKFYSIQGAIVAPGGNPTMPLSGSGYMDEGTIFHFSFNSTYSLGGTPYFVQAEGFWDVVAKTGPAYVYISATGNHTYSLTQVDCTASDILYSPESAGSDYLP